jgi:hypothetical protein
MIRSLVCLPRRVDGTLSANTIHSSRQKRTPSAPALGGARYRTLPITPVADSGHPTLRQLLTKVQGHRPLKITTNATGGVSTATSAASGPAWPARAPPWKPAAPGRGASTRPPRSSSRPPSSPSGYPRTCTRTCAPPSMPPPSTCARPPPRPAPASSQPLPGYRPAARDRRTVGQHSHDQRNQSASPRAHPARSSRAGVGNAVER